MKQFNINIAFVDGNNLTIKVDEQDLDALRKAINERGFNIAYLISDGAINLNQVCHISWEEYGN